MSEDKLARTVVAVLSHYLIRKSAEGPGAYNGPLEDLLSRVQARLSEPFLAEVFERFVERPSGTVESETLQLHVREVVTRDADFARELTSALAGRKVSRLRSPRRRTRLILAGVAVILLLVGTFVVGRVTTSRPAQVTAAPTTINVVPPTSLSSAVSTTAPPTSTTKSSTGSAVPAVPGDGASAPKGSPVFLLDLPRPDDEWNFSRGDHDVQLTPYPNSLWNTLATCNSSSYSREQQFRLKNFTRLEVKAVGTDSTSSPELGVKFEVFVNDDAVNAIQTVLVNPGEAKPLSAELPAGVFAVKLRTSFTTAPGKPCRSGNAVWGSPYVVASGS
ncbi:hypothetical protein P3102_15670 [Amycolatopsis sp. QT-25]|uniref:hypothetical protein n=1 Tax=Amycolatopsis sp. QT-25 TaxID=3034022 RepID=UPI0023ED7B1B|nr:hypothetical protein [Amycolatopsis sp. QT-25]WET82538.1 hypothetical protein P3102_15670 [Amycolatopsis sp. QT-25]